MFRAWWDRGVFLVLPCRAISSREVVGHIRATLPKIDIFVAVNCDWNASHSL